jgi:hypothetical protein
MAGLSQQLTTPTRSNGQACASLTVYVIAHLRSPFEAFRMRSPILWLLQQSSATMNNSKSLAFAILDISEAVANCEEIISKGRP